MVKHIAQSGFLFGSASPFTVVPSSIKPNKRFEFVPFGHPTRKSDALLLAAQADRYTAQTVCRGGKATSAFGSESGHPMPR
mgnify:CR=1 FL=1